MQSVTELYNKALAHLGAKRLLSPTDNSPLATACGDAYPSDRDAVLRMHPWNCAIARYDLNRLTTDVTEVDDGSVYAFQLPSDCLRILDVAITGDVWRREGDRIITDSATCAIRYVQRITDVVSFDPLLAECIALKMAATLALNGIGSRERAIDMERRFDAMMAEARYADALERNRDTLTPIHLTESRI
jgi:hypothetical protein